MALKRREVAALAANLAQAAALVKGEAESLGTIQNRRLCVMVTHKSLEALVLTAHETVRYLTEAVGDEPIEVTP